MKNSISCTTPFELIKELTDLVCNSSSEKWFFRGQNCSDWEIIPNLWREDERAKKAFASFCNKKAQDELESRVKAFKNRIFASEENIKNCILWYEFELYLQSRFLELSNEAGIPINYFAHKGNHTETREILKRINFISAERLSGLLSNARKDQDSFNFRSTIQHYSEEIAALSQHHGLYSRLLDFSKNPLTAAFFAAYSKESLPCPVKCPEQKISISAIRIVDEKKYVQLTQKIDFSANKFLHAQQGVFLLIFGDEYFLNHGKWPSLEMLEKEYESESGFELRKFTLPYEKKDLLLEKLADFNIRNSTIRPSFDYVAGDVLAELRFEE